MRTLLVAAVIIAQVYSARAAEVVTEAKVVEVDGASLKELRAGTAGFVVNVSENVARSLREATQSRTLQSFQLATVDENPVQSRVSSRLGSLDIGINFELTAAVSIKREIHFTVISRLEVRQSESEAGPSQAVFTGESVRHDITTAEGATVLVSGLVTQQDARQLAKMEALRDSPILKSFYSEESQAMELILILTPRIVRAPALKDVYVKAAPPARPEERSDDSYTVQVGAFQNRVNANALLAELEKRHQDVFIQESAAGKPVYRVRVGRFASLEEVKRIEKALRAEGFSPFIAQLR